MSTQACAASSQLAKRWHREARPQETQE